MWIEIDKLKRRPRQIVIDKQATDFPALRDLAEKGIATFSENIIGTLEVTRTEQVIKVAGCLTTTVTSPCGRCLMPVTGHLKIPILLSYVDCENVDAAPLAEEVEIQSEEIELIPFSGTEIDLQPDLAQEIIMALPQQPLCQEACQGLCPTCGNNLNQGGCDCEPPVFHAGLAALKNFKADL